MRRSVKFQWFLAQHTKVAECIPDSSAKKCLGSYAWA
jgi:hypothetical protein